MENGKLINFSFFLFPSLFLSSSFFCLATYFAELIFLCCMKCSHGVMHYDWKLGIAMDGGG